MPEETKRITWDAVGEREFETGVDRGVLYPCDSKGVYQKGCAWNGLTGVDENPSGGEANALYADNIKYLNIMSAEEFGATINAYMYPDEFEECDGSKSLTAGVTVGQQKRKMFGLSYRTLKGNDIEDADYGYVIHLIYGCKASPSDKSYETVNDSPDGIIFSWEVSTTPVEITKKVNGEELKPTSHLKFDSTKTDAKLLTAIEGILYGTDTEDARLPLPDEIIDLIEPQGNSDIAG